MSIHVSLEVSTQILSWLPQKPSALFRQLHRLALLHSQSRLASGHVFAGKPAHRLLLLMLHYSSMQAEDMLGKVHVCNRPRPQVCNRP